MCFSECTEKRRYVSFDWKCETHQRLWRSDDEGGSGGRGEHTQLFFSFSFFVYRKKIIIYWYRERRACIMRCETATTKKKVNINMKFWDCAKVNMCVDNESEREKKNI